jgi:hypothetical protein
VSRKRSLIPAPVQRCGFRNPFRFQSTCRRSRGQAILWRANLWRVYDGRLRCRSFRDRRGIWRRARRQSRGGPEASCSALRVDRRQLSSQRGPRTLELRRHARRLQERQVHDQAGGRPVPAQRHLEEAPGHPLQPRLERQRPAQARIDLRHRPRGRAAAGHLGAGRPRPVPRRRPLGTVTRGEDHDLFGHHAHLE